MGKKVTEKKGSFTIELTLLFPVIMAILLLIIYSDYYVHDRVIIERACYISALRGSLNCETGKSKQIAADEFYKEIEGKLLGKWEYEIEVYSTSEEVKIEFEGFMYSRQGLLWKIIDKRMFVYSSQTKSDIANETEYLRTVTKGK